MAAQPYRSTVTFDGTKINAVSSVVAFKTDKDHLGMPQMGSLRTTIEAWIDFHDDKNLPHDALKKLFDNANVVTRDKIKDLKIEFWKDDEHKDALCSYKCKAWIRGFHTSNPSNSAALSGEDDLNINHLLVVEFEPVLNQQNFQEISMSN